LASIGGAPFVESPLVQQKYFMVLPYLYHMRTMACRSRVDKDMIEENGTDRMKEMVFR
jgi:hypothetical protein